MEYVPSAWCTWCKRFKPKTEFSPAKQSWNGVSSNCKMCCRIIKANSRMRPSNNDRAYTKVWQQNNLEATRRHNKKSSLKFHYDLTVEAYTAMLQVQFYKCAVCEDKFDIEDSKKVPCIDHDHETGKLRELICRKCNSMLGLALDDPKRLERAIAYLRRHGK